MVSWGPHANAAEFVIRVPAFIEEHIITASVGHPFNCKTVSSKLDLQIVLIIDQVRGCLPLNHVLIGVD